MKTFQRGLVATVTVILLLSLLLPAAPKANAETNNTALASEDNALSSSQIFYPIDMSKDVLASRINQKVSGDCAVVSMATIEAYLYGATTASEKNTVYSALVSKNKDDNYAYWSNCGYATKQPVNWTEVYNQLAKGYPVIVHRPATSTRSEHWAVVAGYNGSTTTLEKDKFIMVDVYRGSGGKDIMTTGEWRNGTTINRMTYRKNGIAITSLSGIRFAIDHPAALHVNGNGHGVYGYITSNTNITSVRVMVTNATTAVNSFNKTVVPNAKSYLIYNLDSALTFAKWANGEYMFTVVVETETEAKAYQKFFRIANGWPKQIPTKSYTVTFDTNGGPGAVASQTVTHDGTPIVIPTAPVRTGYTFKGWTVKRVTDGRVFCVDKGWSNESNGYAMKLYAPGEEHVVRYDWLRACLNNTGFVFTAQWEKHLNTYTVTYDANGGNGAPTSQTKTQGIALTLSTKIPTRTGYVFGGWTTKQNATSPSYQPGGTYNLDANMTLYALWTESHTCKVNFVPRKNATCTESGKNAYYLCTCGKSYEDASAAKPISDISNWGIIKPTGHTPSEWRSNGEYHWKECTTTGCNSEISGTKTAHTGGSASCTTLAKCNTCLVSYGTHAAHVWGNQWHAANHHGHTKKCQTAGCTASSTIEAHTPGAAATETTPQICTGCGYIVQPAKGHTHTLVKVEATQAHCESAGNIEYFTCDGCSHWFADDAGKMMLENYSDVVIAPLEHDWANATCTAPKTCKHDGCNATDGTPLGHSYAITWNSSKDGHMHTCECGNTTDPEPHYDNNQDGLCDECQYETEINDVNIPDQESPDNGIPLWAIIVFIVSVLSVLSSIVILFASRRKANK